MIGVRDKVTDLIFRARVVGQTQARNSYRETAAVHDTSTEYGVAENLQQPSAVPTVPDGAGEMQAAANQTQGEAATAVKPPNWALQSTNASVASLLLHSPLNATIVGRTNVPVQLGDYVSADGTLVAEVWPSGSREIQEDGASRFEQWRGGTLVRNIATGDVESRTELIDDQGLHSPWLTELVPFLYVKPGQSQLFIYDPTNGKKTVMDLQALTSWTVAQTAPVLLPGSKLAALSMVDGDQHGYVLVVDLVSRQVRSAIEVGPSPTNLVLARKEH